MKSKVFRYWKTVFSALALLLLVASAKAQPAAAQAEEPDDNTKAMNYSLYYEEFKNKNYESALPNLRWILAYAPAYPRNDDRNFERARDLYIAMAEQSEGDQKKAWLDSALTIFDIVVPTLKDAGAEVDEAQWLIRKGRFLQTHAANIPDANKMVGEVYRKAYELDPDKVDAYTVQVIIADYVERGDKAGAVAFMETVEQQHADDQDLITYITQMRNSLFDSPEERMGFLETQFDKNPGNLEIANELFEIYRELGIREKMYAMGDRLSQMEPSAATYRILAKLRLDDGEAQEAFELYQKALDMPGAEAKAEDYYNMGIALSQLGQLNKARTYYRQSLGINPKFGRALVGIGDLYVTAVSECGAALEREDKAVYWLAVDYYNRARSADPTVANAANQKARTYSKYFPSAEDKFFKGWQNGQSYNINYGCYSWIGESTTVK